MQNVEGQPSAVSEGRKEIPRERPSKEDVPTGLENSDHLKVEDMGTKKSSGKIRLILILIVVLGSAGFLYYWRSRGFESTDDAFIDGDIVQIAPRVAGQVIKVHVQDNQHVRKGELLAEIDPRDYETALNKAKAELASALARNAGAQAGLDFTATVTSASLMQAEAGLRAARDQVEVLRARLAQEKANVGVAEAKLRQAEARRAAAEAQAARAGNDAARYRTLYEKDEVSRQLLDRAETEARALAAELEAARQTVNQSQAQLAHDQAALASAEAALRQAEALVRQAEGRLQEAQSQPAQVRLRQAGLKESQGEIERMRAALAQAELNLSYTKIFAPDSGYITRKSVQTGNIVQPGQVLMALVSDRLWVTANFKETQLAHMRPGQPATVKIDAYPQRRFHGKVDSIQSGSGARFSLLPPENATGNYVKVVQRVPVKIVFTEALPPELKVGPGMSVVPEVKIR